MIVLTCLLICSVLYACYMTYESFYHLKMWRRVHNNNLELSEQIRVLEEKYCDVPTIMRDIIEKWDDDNLTK